MIDRWRVAAVKAALVTVVQLAIAPHVLGASPSPSAGSGGDPRSSGQGPGLVGDPAFALLAVVAMGLGALLLTLAYIRLTNRRES